jgi:hypothetical protein
MLDVFVVVKSSVDNWSIENSSMKSLTFTLAVLSAPWLLMQDAAFSQTQVKDALYGTIRGQVIDAATKSPISGASILVLGTQRGVATDERGEFMISRVPVGSHTVSIHSLSYRPVTKTDIIVRPKRITFIEEELQRIAVELKGIEVRAGYFSESPSQPIGMTKFSSEEVRRSPGSGGDVSRVISILPCAAKVTDFFNSLVIRGGSAAENGFYLDNIEIPNINHYPIQGSTGGPIGLLNVDFIQDVTFSAGGFSAIYGNRLSSIMDLKFREGNRDGFDAQVDMNLMGFGIAGEGPIYGGQGSWLFSVRHSFLDLLVDAIGTGVTPRYNDYQGKLVYEISPRNMVTVLGVLGNDLIEFDREQSVADGNAIYGRWDSNEWVSGINWRCLWSSNGYSVTSLSLLSTRYRGTFFATSTDRNLTEENSLERSIQLRNVSAYQFNESAHLEFGLDGKYIIDNYDFSVCEYTNIIGDTVAALDVDERIESPKAGIFVSFGWNLLPKLTTMWGARYDYFEYNGHSHVAPRFSISYQLSERLSLNGACGIYYQNLPLHLLVQRKTKEHLKDPIARHYILGIGFLLTEDTKLTLEGYFKSFGNFPLDLGQPQLFVVDDAFHSTYFETYEQLVDEGRARAWGVELTLQKKLVRGVYGLVSGSYFRSRYRALDGVWRDRVIDNRFVVGVEGGYKPNNQWEFSVRWILAGGRPYTPLDIGTSRTLDRTVLDDTRVNQSRYPDYHSMNIRCDRRFHFSGSNLILYFSAWNVYDQQNVFNYYWNRTEQRQDATYQWGLLPVFGLEFEF